MIIINVKDLSGTKINNLKVLSYHHTDSHGKHYLCECICGNRKIYRGSTLTSGAVIGCGCNVGKSNKGLEHKEQALKKIGEKHGRLKIIGIQKVRNQYEMVCECKCGNTKIVKYFDLINEKVVSCGCYQKENASKIGTMYGIKNYKPSHSWYFMIGEKKVNCRSGYEVIYANYLTENNIEFEYEPKHFKLRNGRRYTPDFYLINQDKYVEIKGTFKNPNLRQKDNIDIFKETHNHEIMYWKDIVEICKLPLKVYNSYFKRAKKKGMEIEDYLAEKEYL